MVFKKILGNGILKHKALYKNGKIVDGYGNYYDNSQLERKFTVFPDNNAEMVYISMMEL